ncbi:MAG: DNA-binding protein [Nitrospirota bacterium]
MKRSGILMIALIMMIGTGVAYASPEKPAPAAAAKTPSVKAEKEDPNAGLSGKVVETMDAGGYTYVCLEKNGKKTWVAVSQMKVAVGSMMTFQPGSVMQNFTSKSLGKTFDSIIFSGGPAAGSAPAVKPAAGAQPQGATGSKAQIAALDKAVKVEKAAGANAYTVAEVYAKRTALNKKTVAVKGKVVKVSQGIMGKNWIHIQDGSGDQQKGTHNLVATTQDMAAVGDIVTITGTFAKDRDFGAGYLYKAIVEDAKVKK